MVYQIISVYFEDDCADELTLDPVFNAILEKNSLASQPTLSRFFNRMEENTLLQFDDIDKSLRDIIYSIKCPEPMEHGRADDYLESRKRNLDCKKAIEDAIRKNFDGMHLSHDAAREVLKEYGTERVVFILANTVQHLEHDGRFSIGNKAWAKGYEIPENINRGMDMNADYLRSIEGGEEQNYSFIDGNKNNCKKKKGRVSVLAKLRQKQAEIARRSGKPAQQMAMAEDMERRRK